MSKSSKSNKKPMTLPTREGDFISNRVSYMVQAIRGAIDDEYEKQFWQLKTDSERFQHLWKKKEVQEVLWLEKEFVGKSEKLAREHREAGNSYFQKKCYVTALSEYSLSVIHAPASGSSQKTEEKAEVISEPSQSTDEKVENGKNEDDKDTNESKNELALAFANRSASLFHLKKYKECLEDIKLAFENKYPEELQYKLFDRKGNCFLELGNQSEAITNFKFAQDFLAKASLNDKARASWTKTLAKQLDRCQVVGSESKSDQDAPQRIPKLTGASNLTHPNCSDAVRIKYNNVVGRYVVADQDIKVGDVIMVEKPFASVLFEGFHKTHCYHCFKQVQIPVPCYECASIVFCSYDCRNASWDSFHKFECNYFALFDTLTLAKIGHLAARLLMVIGLNPLLEFLKNSQGTSVDPEKVGMNEDGIYLGGYDSIFYMDTHEQKRKSDTTLFEFTVVACLLMKILQLVDYVHISADSPDFASIGGALLRHLKIIQCNSKRIVEQQQPNKFDDSKPTDLGIGIYPTAALVNHSCDPSADINCFDNRIVLRTVRNIYQGEEVNISYGPIFYEVKTLLRQNQLKAAYYFHCNCVACWNKWPIHEEMFDEAPGYRCENCRGVLTTEDKFENKFLRCAICHHQQDLENIVCQLQNSYDLFAKAMNDAMSGRTKDALPNFVQHLLLLQRHIRHPWRDLASCQSSVKQCFRLEANVKQL